MSATVDNIELVFHLGGADAYRDAMFGMLTDELRSVIDARAIDRETDCTETIAIFDVDEEPDL